MNIDDLISQLEISTISTNYIPLNKDQIVIISKSLEHFSSGLAIGKKERANSVVQEKKREISKLLNLLVFEVSRIYGPSLKKRYSSLVVELLIAFQNLIQDEEDVNTATGVVWSACREFQTGPETNCQQVAQLLSFITEMIQDAFEEAEQLSQGITFDGQVINLDENSSKYFTEVKSLIKLCILCVKKAQTILNTCTEDESWIIESENLLLLGNELSSRIDDFVSTLDIPLQTQDQFLSTSLKKAFSVCKDLIKRLEVDQKWNLLASAQLAKLESSLGVLIQ